MHYGVIYYNGGTDLSKSRLIGGTTCDEEKKKQNNEHATLCCTAKYETNLHSQQMVDNLLVFEKILRVVQDYKFYFILLITFTFLQ